jgi:hypothetical protein
VRSSANAVTAKVKTNASQNDRVILEGERITPSCYYFKLIRAADLVPAPLRPQHRG